MTNAEKFDRIPQQPIVGRPRQKPRETVALLSADKLSHENISRPTPPSQPEPDQEHDEQANTSKSEIPELAQSRQPIRQNLASKCARPNDTGVGRPKVLPRNVRDVTTTDEQINEAGSAPRINVATLIQQREIWAPSFLRKPIVYFSSLLLISMMGIWLLSTTIGLIASLATLPGWVAYPLTAILIVLLGIVFYVLGLAIYKYCSVPYTPQLKLEQIRKAQVEGHNAYSTARDYLENHLRAINASDKGYFSVLKQMDLKEIECDQFEHDLKALLNNRRIEGKAWLHEYQDNIQSVVDGLALRRIRKCATTVGLKTAISPWKAVDLMAVFYNNTILVKDLCLLANRRVSNLQSLSILTRVGFNMYVASEAQEIARQTIHGALNGGYKQVADDITAGKFDIENMLDGSSEGAAELAAATSQGVQGMAGDGLRAVTKFAGYKMVEGIANGWLTHRFGTRVWSMLKPLSE
jgi:uncharacterized membrane protein YcjF (UPF0283 family)